MLRKLGLVSLLGIGLLSGCASTPQKHGINPEVIFISNYRDPLEHQTREFYEEMINKNPKDWKAHLYFAEELMENAQPMEAAAHYEKLWEIMEPDKIPQLAYFHLQEAYSAVEQKKSALMIAKFAIEKWPNDPMVWRHLAQRYEDHEMWGFALMAWKKKQSLKETAVNKFRKFDNNSEEEKLMENASISQCYVNLGKYEEALELNDKLIQKYPEKSMGYTLRGNIYEEMRKYGHALDDFNMANLLNQKNNAGDAADIERIKKKIHQR